MGLDFRVLGPVEVWCDGRRLPLGGPKPRALLAALLLQPGRVVSADALVDTIWGEEPPDTARALIQTYVSGLRRSLPGEVIETRPPGYLFRTDAGAVDRAAFERLVAESRRAAADGDHPTAARGLAEALALWRGPALGGIGEALRVEADRLEEARLAALEERIAAELEASGHETELVAELTALVGAHPTRERLRGQLMVALYRLDRQADALAVYAEGRAVLADELGIDPGPGLNELYEAILRADPALLTPASAASSSTTTGSVSPVRPALLPPTIGDFTGREAPLDTLVAALSGPRDAVPVMVLSGPGGVGKSTLAVEGAHQAASAYPDGQLYAELRGFTETPLPPEEVLGRLLRALGTDPPGTLAERIDLFRSTVAGRRILLVLDDARSEAQVRPLLPGSPTCGVVITSRARLFGLVGAQRLDLDVLDHERAVQLLARVAGEGRVREEPEAARRIVELCGGLPLAIRIAGARLAARRDWTPQVLADRLADERRRLDELTVGDLEVRAGVGLSYRALSDPARTALRRLGLLGAPDVPAWVIAALLDVPEAEADRVLEQLLNAQLLHFSAIDRVGQSRFRLHDLVRVYAAERAGTEDTEEERAAALGRAVGGWLWLTDRVAAAVPTGTVVLRPAHSAAWPLEPEVTRRALADPLAWSDAESDAIAVAVERAAAMGLHALACEAAVALCSSSYAIGNCFEAWWRTHDAALTAVRRAGDRSGEAPLLVGLGQLRYEQDRFAEAQDYFQQGLVLYTELGDVRGEAAALAGLGCAYREQGRLRAAERALTRAVGDFRRLGDESSLGLTCRYAGSVHIELGEYEAARTLLDEALRSYRRQGSRRGEALTLRSIGLMYRALGDYERAEELCEQALDILRGLGDRLMAAYAVQARAKSRIRLGRTADAAPDLLAACEVCRDNGDRFGEALMLRTLGECELADGRPADAERHLMASVALWEAMDLPLPRARTLRDLASVREALGDPAGAAALRDDALEVFEACEARERQELGARSDCC
ncbi:BTAD domain-containing putative transcriptional regulator [Streptomyces sp. KR80]|uniref:BTAD domain-containing putative transcriptional regulator n=1 Tax=Streptomyces sp. KR80 TaxID=3457426 RepID=UPI003FD19CEC